MKDNKENLNNELSNEAAEAVAGGRWTPEDLATLGNYSGWFQQNAMRFNSPRHFILSLIKNWKKGNPYYDGCRVKARNIRDIIEDFNLLDDDVCDDFLSTYCSKYN